MTEHLLLGRSCPYSFDNNRAVMRRLPAVPPLIAFNGKLSSSVQDRTRSSH